MLAPELLKLFYLVSPALPIGAYAYSQGQEYAVDSNWLDGENSLYDWISGVLRHSIGSCDLPILQRCHEAWENQDYETLNRWNEFLLATRETKELLLEDNQLGIAFARVLETHAIDEHKDALQGAPSFAILFALAGVKWQIPKQALMYGFAWSWVENQVAAATKTIPLGQSQAQLILMKLIDDIPDLVVKAQNMKDEDLGAGLPGLALASCLHERQYSRLFRS